MVMENPPLLDKGIRRVILPAPLENAISTWDNEHLPRCRPRSGGHQHKGARRCQASLLGFDIDNPIRGEYEGTVGVSEKSRISHHLDLYSPLPALDDQLIIQEQIRLGDNEILVEVSSYRTSYVGVIADGQVRRALYLLRF